MPLIALPPHIIILDAVVAQLQTVDFLDRAGVANVTVRHRRSRFSTTSEQPCIAVAWLGNSDHSPGGPPLTEWERTKLCEIDLNIDMAIATETGGSDPTGWLEHSRLASASLEALRDPAGLLYPALCDWIVSGEEKPDPESKPDDGRLVKSLSVVYRIRTDDENVLLAQGVNG